MTREEWDQRYAGRMLWTAEPNRFVAAELSGLTPGRALDLATGQGRNAVWLASQGWQVTAVDFSETGLEAARRLAAERGVAVDWVGADVLEYTPAPGGYQLVLIAYLHLAAASLARVLRGAVTALAPGGTILVIGHDVANLSDGTGGPQDPAVLYTPELITAELGGLQVTRAERVRRPVESDDGVREAIDTLVRATRPAEIDTPAGMIPESRQG
ncbi:MAG: class I SAM-dependent methyltransferase [Micromonosporaceae bacterium]